MKGKKTITLAGFMVLSLLLITSTLIAACAQEAPAGEEMDRVTFRHGWVPDPDRPSFLVGLEKGFYAEEGIDIEVKEGVSGITNAQLVGSGVNEFAEDGVTDVIEAIQAGMAVKAIYVLDRQSPIGLISRADNPINHPKDLEGKSIAGGPGSSSLAFLPAVMQAAGADFSTVNVRIVDWGAIDSMLLLGKVDAIPEYWTSTVPRLNDAGLEVTVLKYAEWGVNTPGSGIQTSDQLIAENPDLIRRFIRASDKALKYSMENPEEAMEIFLKYYPDRAGDIEGGLQAFRNSWELLYSAATVGKPLGWMAKEDWEFTQNIMFDYLELPEKLPVENYYTNEFIPQ